jgi:lysyl-tRNA synthetase class 2
MPLAELREKAGLSGKKWDRAVKDLTKNDILQVEKTDQGLQVRLL